jgi:hypothetical protein
VLTAVSSSVVLTAVCSSVVLMSVCSFVATKQDDKINKL